MSTHNEFPGDQDTAEGAARLAEEARGQAHTTVSNVARQAHEGIDRAGASVGKGDKPQMNERINQGLKAMGQQIGGLAEQLRQRAPEGQGGDLAVKAATVLDQSASYLQGADAQSVQADLEALIRRNPLQAMGIGVAFGFLLGRALKG